jgi:hypothetical protein
VIVRWSARPRVRLVVGAAIAALALAGGALAVVAVEDLVPGSASTFDGPLRGIALDLMVSVAVTTPLLLALALVIGVARSTRAGLRTFFACAVLGWLNCPASLVVNAVLFDDPIRLPWAIGSALIMGAFVGLFFATPFGMLYGVAHLFATKRLRALLDRPTVSAKNDALFTVAITVLGAASLATLVAALREAPVVPWWAPATLAGLATLAAVYAVLRGRWIRSLVRDPARGAFERVSLEELGIDGAWLLPLHAAVSVGATHALLRKLPAGEGAYRRSAPRVPIALVD